MQTDQSSSPHATEPSATPRWLSRFGEPLLLGLIFLAALAVRLWTIRGGLPYVDHPDEPNPINYVLQMMRSGDLNPHAFQKPSFYVYLELIVLSIHYQLGLHSGLYGPLDQMTISTYTFTTIPGFFIWGRTLTALLGSLTVLVVYALGRRVWSGSAGLIAALFLAASQFHMQHSQYVTTDVPSGLLVALSFYASLRIAQQGRWRDYLLAGALAGVAASTKYNVGVIVLPIVAAHGLFWRGALFREFPRLLAAGAICIGAFFAGTPYALLSWDEFLKGVLGQAAAYNDGSQGDIRGAWNVRGYWNFFWNTGLLPAGCLATLAGIGFLWRRQRAIALLWLSFSLPYLLLLLAQETHFQRNFIPLVVLCTLPIGATGAAVSGWLGQRLPRYRLLLAAAVVLVLVLPGATATAAYTARWLRGDTRSHLLDWLEANVSPGTRIAAEMRPLPGPLDSPWISVSSLPTHDLTWYRQQGYRFLIASSDAWHSWDAPESYAAFGTPLVSFGGATSRDMFGPHLHVYDTGLSVADIPLPLSDPPTIGGARLLGVAVGEPLADDPELGLTPTTSFAAGTTLGLRTFWQVDSAFGEDYFIFVHVLNAQGERVAQRDAPPWQGRYPTTSWKPGTLVVDINNLPLPADLPAGSYSILVGMYSPELGSGPPGSSSVTVTQIQVH